jgi:hypothetical protein
MSDEAASLPECDDGHEVETDASPQIEMSPAAVAALRARGGNLYVWAEGAGLLRARAKNPPRESISYDTFSSDGCSIHVDQGIEPATRWLIKWTRLPWPHFQAFYNPSKPETFDKLVEGIIDGITRG